MTTPTPTPTPTPVPDPAAAGFLTTLTGATAAGGVKIEGTFNVVSPTAASSAIRARWDDTAKGYVVDTLTPTPIHVALLTDIANGRISGTDDLDLVLHFQEDGEDQTVRVTAAVLEMQQAGWCQPVDNTTWQLTAAGQAILRGTPK